MDDISPEERFRRERIVIEECDGINGPYEAFYLDAIKYAAGRALKAFERYDAALNSSSDQATIVSNVQEALTHIAVVSRFFWPQRSKGKLSSYRAAKLRASFGLLDDSPLKARDIRNALEHFDERLDEYLLKDIAGYFFPAAMVGSANLADDQMGHIFRMVDPDSQTFVLFGKKYPFQDLRLAVDLVHHLAEQAYSRGGRLPRDDMP